MATGNPRRQTARKIRSLLPSRQYLKLYASTIGLFHAMLLLLFLLFGRHLGYADVWPGVLLISLMMVFSFAAVLLFGVLLRIIDPD